MSKHPELEDLVVVGRKFNVTYNLGNKDLGEVKVVALHSSTLQTVSTLTGNTLWLPNLLCGDVIAMAELFTVNPRYCVYESGKIIYTYEFLPLENSDEQFSAEVIVDDSMD